MSESPHHLSTYQPSANSRRRAGAVTVLLASLAISGQATAATADRATVPVVVAVIGEPAGVNVLHQDFRTPDGRAPHYPASMPTPVMIGLPHQGSFAAQRSTLESGPLGHLTPGVLYAVAGTRLLLINTGTSPYDAAQPEAVHATGVADSVTGTRYGTNPNALVVVALTDGNQTQSYDWLAQTSWVHLASTSDYTIFSPGLSGSGTSVQSPGTTQCEGAADVRAFTSAGHQLFASAGNTTDQPEPLVAPNGLPETYLVGGVDSSGNTWRPGHTEEPNPFYSAGNVVRPYETGELFSYTAAGPDSITGTQHFGGTSGATPRTAGWAALLVAHARQTLHTNARVPGTLAAGAHHPARGPLADGRFTRDELVHLLHAVAVPHGGLPNGAAYALEGYGALNASAIAHAERALDGVDPVPFRPGDDQADSAAHALRRAVFTRC